MPRNKVGSSNGGIIGKTNKTSFGKCTVTTKTSSGDITLQPGTAVVKTLLVGGGGGGGFDGGGGGGAGGLRNIEINASGTVPVTIGAAGSAGTSPNPGGTGGDSSIGRWFRRWRRTR